MQVKLRESRLFSKKSLMLALAAVDIAAAHAPNIQEEAKEYAKKVRDMVRYETHWPYRMMWWVWLIRTDCA